MKRKLVSLLLVVVLAACVTLPVFASADMEIPYVVDSAGVLSDSQWQTLNAQAEQISAEYDCSVIIITVDNYRDYVDGGIEDFTEYMYNQSITDTNCVMLALSMSDRNFDLMAHGDICNTAFTDDGKQWLQEQFLGSFGNDDWYGGFSVYLSGAEMMLHQSEAGNPVDVGNRPLTTGAKVGGIVIVVALSMLVALIACLIGKAGMKSVRARTDANAYETQEGIRLNRKVDRFTHSTQVVHQINQSNGGSGGGTTVNSGGFSHSSGKF